MSEKTAQAIEISRAAKPVNGSRALPLAIAGLICFTISVLLGYGSWYLFGSRDSDGSALAAAADVQKTGVSAPKIETPAETVLPMAAEASNQTETVQTEAAQPAATSTEIEGIVDVEGGEFSIGGDASRPLQRFIINNFAVAETEVTNAHYAEFIKETNYPAPPGWRNGKIRGGAENYPVTNVSWRDADAFCKWMAKKLGAEVRLPTEAEWELAAGGRTRKKYPWGDRWDKEAGNSLETGGKTSPVKSFALNHSPSGAFDMVGNVWEWTADKVTAKNGATDQDVERALKGGQTLRVVKGGSASEKASQISVQVRYEIPELTKDKTVGFRYVVVPK